MSSDCGNPPATTRGEEKARLVAAIVGEIAATAATSSLPADCPPIYEEQRRRIAATYGVNPIDVLRVENAWRLIPVRKEGS